MRPITCLVAVLVFAPLTRVTAQEPPPVKVGDRVRVTIPDMGVRNRDGTLRLLDADSLVMRPNGGPSRLVIPLASLTRFEVHQVGSRTPPSVPWSARSLLVLMDLLSKTTRVSIARKALVSVGDSSQLLEPLLDCCWEPSSAHSSKPTAGKKSRSTRSA